MTMPDYVELEMPLAELMAQQEASGFRFDLHAAETVKSTTCRKKQRCLEIEKDQTSILCDLARSSHLSVRTPLSGYHSGAPMTHLT